MVERCLRRVLTYRLGLFGSLSFLVRLTGAARAEVLDSLAETLGMFDEFLFCWWEVCILGG